MPIHVNHTVRYDTTERSIFVPAWSIDGRPATSLRVEAPGLRAAYVRIGESPVDIALTPGRLDTWISGGFVEVDEDLMPGVYKLDVPDAAMTYGAPEAMVILRCDAATFDPIDLTLVAYDPHDPRALGLFQLRQRTRHDFLRKALPKFTEMDMALDEGGNYSELMERYTVDTH